MHRLLVFQTDFGRLEGTVAEMYGVALSVDPRLVIHEITHLIPQFDIWEASYRLMQSVPFWPEDTVFVSVVDPGVGTERRSVVARTETGHWIVTPDNGSLTHLDRHFGINALREIDETVNRVPGSEESQTFHGRDVYGYTGARLAAGVIDFSGVGAELDPVTIRRLPLSEPEIRAGGARGIVEILDTRYGNIWTNIPKRLFEEAGFSIHDTIRTTIYNGDTPVYRAELPYEQMFGAVKIGEEVVYCNELLSIALSVNQGDFARRHGIGSGPEWSVHFETSSHKE